MSTGTQTPVDWMATYPGPADLAAFLLEREQAPHLRQIIEDHSAAGGFGMTESWHDDQNRCRTCSFEATFDTETGPLPEPEMRHVRFPCLTLRNLAVPYSDHPAFRDDWKTE